MKRQGWEDYWDNYCWHMALMDGLWISSPLIFPVLDLLSFIAALTCSFLLQKSRLESGGGSYPQRVRWILPRCPVSPPAFSFAILLSGQAEQRALILPCLPAGTEIICETFILPPCWCSMGNGNQGAQHLSTSCYSSGFVISFSQRQRVLDIPCSNCARKTVKGKRHLAAQAASVLGAEKGLVLLPDFTRGFFWILENKWQIGCSTLHIETRGEAAKV